MNLKMIVSILTAFLILAVGAAVYYYLTLTEELSSTQTRLVSSSERVSQLQEQLTRAKEENNNLLGRLQKKEDQLQELSDQVSEITGEVVTLQKLKETDEELLKKYSKVYFLNEHYFPSELDPIDDDYVYKENEIEEIHGKVKPFLEDLLEEAEDDGIDLRIISAYRSFDEQSTLKAHYSVVYGAGTANQFSADQGYSEHQLGTTIDVTTPALGVSFTQFGQTEAYEWLQDNAYKYGFVLSYPENNAYYRFEPWHWRFVGQKLARDLHRRDVNFYDMPQREIDEYLVEIFE